jgi:hypothetical protein
LRLTVARDLGNGLPHSGSLHFADTEVFSVLDASTRDEPVKLSDLVPKLISIVLQPVLIAASRCYLIQMLR